MNVLIEKYDTLARMGTELFPTKDFRPPWILTGEMILEL